MGIPDIGIGQILVTVRPRLLAQRQWVGIRYLWGYRPDSGKMRSDIVYWGGRESGGEGKIGPTFFKK